MKIFWNRLKKIIGFCLFKIKYAEVMFIKPLKKFTYFSQYGQDWYLSSLLFSCLISNTNNWILDIGCNHPKLFSNSLFFEKFFNCKTIAVDPLCEYKKEWAELRPSAIFENVALGKEQGKLRLNIPSIADLKNKTRQNKVTGKTLIDSKMFSFVKEEEGFIFDQSKIHQMPSESRVVDCTTVKDLLNKYGVTNILICSIDVEGFEINILKGIDFDNHKINCFCIENNSESKYFGNDEIRSFLKAKGYIFYARIGITDDIFIHSSLLEKLF